ncbi:MAG TPA: glycosyltransferase family 2 protein, partial [Acidobacteriota bacterium]|nr:glycosyltransferase family 2 protein [Acidobacteriota bacterium]
MNLFELIIIWIGLFTTFAGSFGVFYLYLRRNFRKPWNLKFDRYFEPSVSILVPTHNEADVIKDKLQNIK